MNPIVQQMVNYKLNHLTIDELLELSKKYNVTITRVQAQKVIQILQREKVDIANLKQRQRILTTIGKETNPRLMKQIDMLLTQLL
ncbi:DUF2624 family protein [Bacillus taeanensis]|uniref:DUF2624 domain-containing protein n=1 Tax=Bacillus taeanensis TaxID=273032 RepID=A0A366XXA3_9BACI|nr:DUF2624 family protein [Bacillus taeanensis]RBW70527.1 DUF2624 domain-containing protein [Bacillus taeanensis]